jgi:hypothetical protein
MSVALLFDSDIRAALLRCCCHHFPGQRCHAISPGPPYRCDRLQ